MTRWQMWTDLQNSFTNCNS